MTTFPINETKIKMAWREKYLTDGANEQALAHPRGLYRGFWLSPRLAPDRWLRLIINPYAPGDAIDKDQFAVYRHTDNSTGVDGFAVSIRETMDIEFDCEGMWPGVGMPLAADEDWYVYIEASYSPNVVTAANYRVENTDPRIANPDAVILGVIPMHAGDMTFAFTAMPPTAGLYDRRCIPSPTARQLVADYVDGDEPWGLFDGVSRWCLGTGTDGRVFGEPTLDPYTLVAATKFQLSGSFYVGRENAFDVAGQYFVALNALGPALLTGTGRGRIIVSSVVLQSDGLTQLNPFADADSEGFYSNPWLQLGFSDCPPDVSYTGNLNVLCFKKKTLLTLENDPASTFPVGCQKVPEHATNVVAKNQAGAPDSLAGVTVTAQLLELLGLVNDRIETIHNDATPGNWVLLWRSHNITLDANVTKQTSSLYFGDKGLALLHGGYIKIADGDVYAGTGAAGDDVSILYLRSGGTGGLTFGVKSGPVSPAHWDVETGWTFYSDYSGTAIQTVGAPIEPYGGIEWGLGAFPDMINSIFAGADYYKYEETTNSNPAVPRTRKYYRQAGMEYAYNCSYDAATGDWSADKDGFPAFALRVDTAGMTLYRKEEIPAIPTTWADVGGWDSYWTLGAGFGAGLRGLGCFGLGGETYEIVRFGWNGYVDNADLYVSDICNFRNMHASAPVAGDFTLDIAPGHIYIDSLVKGAVDVGFVDFLAHAPFSDFIVDVDQWGFRISNAADPEGGCIVGSRYTFDGRVIIET